MNDLKIYIDRLKHDQTLKIQEVLSPEFMQVEEAELSFKQPIPVKGEAYLADDHLVIHLNVEVVATLPCSICNKTVDLPIAIKNLYITKPLTEIPGAVFNLLEELRETILLQTPPFTECSQGKCPEREALKIFFKKEEAPSSSSSNFPFSDLN